MEPQYIVLGAIAVGAGIYLLDRQQQQAQSLSDGGVASDPTNPASWQFGPDMNGINYSPNMPPLVKTADGLQITVPPMDGLHYFTKSTDPLVGKTKISSTIRIDLSPGAKLVPSTAPDGPALACLYFQRDADNWSGQGAYETYRWYASFATLMPLESGTFTLEAPLDANWTAVLTSSVKTNPTAFQAALANTGRVGIVFGGGTGLGHGIYVVGGTCTITVLDFKVE